MKRINFDKRYALLIALGIKQTTIRNKRKAEVGEKVMLTVNDDTFAEAHVTDIELVTMRKLTDRHAQSDGFESIKSLKKALKKYYPELSEDDDVYIIHFRVDRIINFEVILDELMHLASLGIKFVNLESDERETLLIFLKGVNDRERLDFLRKNHNKVIKVLRKVYDKLLRG